MSDKSVDRTDEVPARTTSRTTTRPSTPTRAPDPPNPWAGMQDRDEAERVSADMDRISRKNNSGWGVG